MAVDEGRKNLELDLFNAQDIADTMVDMTKDDIKNRKFSFVVNIEEGVEILCDWNSFLDGVLKVLLKTLSIFLMMVGPLS